MSATLKSRVRAKLGSRDARKLRLQGSVPACIQGEGKENLAISIDLEIFQTARRGHQHLFDIEVDGGATETALVRELQWDSLGERLLHVEFRRVVLGRKTEVEVPLEFVGLLKGGLLNHLETQVSLLALPTQIPDKIEVRVEGLEAGATIHASDLILPEGVELDMDADTLIATVNEPAREAEPEPEGEEGEGAEIGETAAEEKADDED